MPKDGEKRKKSERFQSLTYNTRNHDIETIKMPGENNGIPVSELIKEAAKIKEYNGDEKYDLSSFIREAELVLPLFNDNPQLKEFIFQRYIRNKIQGAALPPHTIPKTNIQDNNKTTIGKIHQDTIIIQTRTQDNIGRTIIQITTTPDQKLRIRIYLVKIIPDSIDKIGKTIAIITGLLDKRDITNQWKYTTMN